MAIWYRGGSMMAALIVAGKGDFSAAYRGTTIS
jgi:hypothetical protein